MPASIVVLFKLPCCAAIICVRAISSCSPERPIRREGKSATSINLSCRPSHLGICCVKGTATTPMRVDTTPAMTPAGAVLSAVSFSERLPLRQERGQQANAQAEHKADGRARAVERDADLAGQEQGQDQQDGQNDGHAAADDASGDSGFEHFLEHNVSPRENARGKKCREQWQWSWQRFSWRSKSLRNAVRRTGHKTARDSAGCVAHAGFEPAVSALRGRRPRPLDEWAVHRRDSTSKRVNCQTLVAKCAHGCLSHLYRREWSLQNTAAITWPSSRLQEHPQASLFGLTLFRNGAKIAPHWQAAFSSNWQPTPCPPGR